MKRSIYIGLFHWYLISIFWNVNTKQNLKKRIEYERADYAVKRNLRKSNKLQNNSYKKPFYKRKWFITVCVLMVIGAIGNSSPSEFNEEESYQKVLKSCETVILPASETKGDGYFNDELEKTLKSELPSRLEDKEEIISEFTNNIKDHFELDDDYFVTRGLDVITQKEEKQVSTTSSGESNEMRQGLDRTDVVSTLHELGYSEPIIDKIWESYRNEIDTYNQKIEEEQKKKAEEEQRRAEEEARKKAEEEQRKAEAEAARKAAEAQVQAEQPVQNTDQPRQAYHACKDGTLIYDQYADLSAKGKANRCYGHKGFAY